MININELTGMDVGRKVIYHQEHYKPEIGHLLSWNSRIVFIRFKSPAGIACDPEDVTFAKELVDPEFDIKREIDQLTSK